MTLVLHVGHVPDGQAAVDQLNRPRPASLASTNKAEEVIGEAVGLHVDLREIALAVILHELLEFLDLDANAVIGSLLFGSPCPRGGFVRLPCEVPRLEPAVFEQIRSIPVVPTVVL